MQLRFTNRYNSPLSVAVMWYSPDTCGGNGGEPWETRGWWNISPGDTVGTNVWTDNRYFCYYAEAVDGAVWGGPYGATVSWNAFDLCAGIGVESENGPDQYFGVGFREVDAGWWHWIYLSYTISLTA